MENSSMFTAVAKLVIAGEQAGFTIEQMIELLDSGVSIESLLNMIESSIRKQQNQTAMVSPPSSSRWIT